MFDKKVSSIKNSIHLEGSIKYELHLRQGQRGFHFPRLRAISASPYGKTPGAAELAAARGFYL